MSAVFSTRREADALRVQLENARAHADSGEVELEMLAKQVAEGKFPPEHEHFGPEALAEKEADQAGRVAEVVRLEGLLEETSGEVAAVLDRLKPLFREHSAEPIALLPVRLETCFADARTIQVRVFPDDLHIDSFDPRLSPAELKAAQAYWRKPGDEAWRRLLNQFSPTRAAWVKRATRPNAPRKPQLRKAGERRLPQITTLPTRWRFLGFVGDEAVIDMPGKKIPSPLPLGVIERDGDGPKQEHARWLVEFGAAEKAGMAVTLTLPDGVDHLDQLFAIGVQQSTAAEASERLRDTLMGHAFGAGLGFLSPGTPTNNTPESRSSWSSRPASHRPRLRRLKAESDGARLAKALGLPEPGFLGDCQGAREMTEQAVAGLTMLSWGALGGGMVNALHSESLGDFETLPIDVKALRGVRDHLIGNVRSRGPLPTIRVGKQPYGILPATSVDEWVPGIPDGPTEPIARWLLRLRHHWRAALAPGWIPRVSDGVLADQAAIKVLARLPVPIDLAVRRLRSPRSMKAKLGSAPGRLSGPVLTVGGVAAGANLRWSVPTELIGTLSSPDDGAEADYSLVTPRLDPKPDEVAKALRASRELWTDALAVTQGKLTPKKYAKRWPPPDSPAENGQGRRDTIAGFAGDRPGFVAALLDVANWKAPENDLGEGDPMAKALELPRLVDELVATLIGPAGPASAEIQASARETARQSARGAPKVIKALEALETVPPERLLPIALEVLDVYSHRYDAWVTSLASRRLHAIRHTKDAVASRVGGYGWVENLHPEPDGPDVDGYIHAPSLQHAATAAVLRSGFRSHDGEEALAVNLSSRRARIARWLLGGVRRGQELGSLLGYRFERALHDAGHDDLIDDVRAAYPLQVAAEPEDGVPQPKLWQRSSEAIAARNVVDGMALARDADKAKEKFGPVAAAIDDLVDALDAVGDLLLAESVHHLVGGNPLRAGIAADTLGRGEDVPDRFDVLRTPSRGRAISHRVAAILPPNPATPPGWSKDALAALEPRLEAWVADALGPASGRRLTGVLVDPDAGDDLPEADQRRFDVGGDQLERGALATALAVSSADTTPLGERVLELVAAPGMIVRFQGAGWQDLRAAATRIRTLLASAHPLLPAHLVAGPGAADVVPDLEELRGRLKSFVATLAGRSKTETAAGRLAEVANQKELDLDWLKGLPAALTEVLGASVPIAPLLKGAALGKAPGNAKAPDFADWVRRAGSVRPAVRTWNELLMLTGASSGRACPLRASQSPGTEEEWIGGPFAATKRPSARQQLVYHAPVPLAGGGQVAGIVFDEWVEVLPGSDALAKTKTVGKKPVPVESELTGLSFHFDRPDAKAPQAILLAVPPNTARGWSGDGLALVVRDTLELAKLRAVDLADLPLLDDVLPGLRLNSQSPLGGLARNYWDEFRG